MNFDHTLLDQFLSRVLELHKSSVIADTQAVAILAKAFTLAANDEPTLNQHMRAALKEVWKRQD